MLSSLSVAPLLTLYIVDVKVSSGKVSTVNFTFWFSFTLPTSASDTFTTSFIFSKFSAITKSSGVENDAATVWPASILLVKTTPSIGLVIIEFFKSIFALFKFVSTSLILASLTCTSA